MDQRWAHGTAAAACALLCARHAQQPLCICLPCRISGSRLQPVCHADCSMQSCLAAKFSLNCRPVRRCPLCRSCCHVCALQATTLIVYAKVGHDRAAAAAAAQGHLAQREVQPSNHLAADFWSSIHLRYPEHSCYRQAIHTNIVYQTALYHAST